VLVDQAAHMTYVTEQNLEPDLTGEPITHPALDQFFNELRDGLYVRDRPLH
jgi:heat shock protein HspQ